MVECVVVSDETRDQYSYRPPNMLVAQVSSLKKVKDFDKVVDNEVGLKFYEIDIEVWFDSTANTTKIFVSANNCRLNKC